MALSIVNSTVKVTDSERRPPHAPAMPRSVEDTGLPFVFLAQLVCKNLLQAGQLDLAQMSARLKLSAGLVEPIAEFLKRERLCEVASTSTGAHRMFALTELGRQRTEEFFRLSHYAGPAPVTLESYVEQVRRQAIADLRITGEDMRRAFDGVVIDEGLLDQLGAAMNSGRAIFLYGPAGAGKTFVAERLAMLLPDHVFVPYAIYVQDQVIQVFDTHSHDPVAPKSDPASPIYLVAGDPRWVLCRRPVVMTGGELTLEMLDLQFDPASRFYAAPPQLKANNGLLIIDDLGRQLAPTRDLMNRWIVPLDRRTDYLALHTGEKFMVPFDVTVVFSTNLSPAQLGDDAFLRRLGYKIRLGALEASQLQEVCKQVCQTLQIPYSEHAVEYLIARFKTTGRPLLACTPRDLLGQVRDQARYRGVPPELSDEALSWAWDNYFASELSSAVTERD